MEEGGPREVCLARYERSFRSDRHSLRRRGRTDQWGFTKGARTGKDEGQTHQVPHEPGLDVVHPAVNPAASTEA